MAHGGKRAGAGRPSQGLTRVNVMLDPGTIKTAQGIGFGNLSAGLREAVRRASRATPRPTGGGKHGR